MSGESSLSRIFKANKQIQQAKDMLKYEDLSPFIDPEKIKYENLDKLNQIEMFALLDKHPMPKKSAALIGITTLTYFGLFTYLGLKKGPSYMLRKVEGKPRSFSTMLLDGTKITSQIFLGYCLTVAPVFYFTDFVGEMERINKIRTRLGNSIIINDDHLQDFILVQTLKYFELSDSLIEQAKLELKTRRDNMKKEVVSLDAVIQRLEAANHSSFSKTSKMHENDDDL